MGSHLSLSLFLFLSLSLSLSHTQIASLQRGSFNCSANGKLCMTLDNSFSYLKQKVCRYDWEILQVPPPPRPWKMIRYFYSTVWNPS